MADHQPSVSLGTPLRAVTGELIHAVSSPW
jgi:hypothetical protein